MSGAGNIRKPLMVSENAHAQLVAMAWAERGSFRGTIKAQTELAIEEAYRRFEAKWEIDHAAPARANDRRD